MGERIRVRVPASSANLGPGFDSFAAALAIFCEVEVRRTGSFAVVTELDLALDRSNLVVRAFERIVAADEYEFRIESQIPLSGGLGSSAAAVVAGLAAAAGLRGQADPIFEDAAELEGHPDNVGAAIVGGFVICAGSRQPVSIAPPAGLAAVLVVPHEPVRTSDARAALSDDVARADAVFNVAGASSLALGLERGDLDLVAASLGDRLHQNRRAHLFPRAAELLGRASAFGALGATVSGAGPTILFWCEDDAAAEAEARLARETRGWAQVRRADFAGEGATVV